MPISANVPAPAPDRRAAPLYPFRSALLRGLVVVLPPLLTVVFFLWVGNMVANYVLSPLKSWTVESIVWQTADIRQNLKIDNPADGTAAVDGRIYKHVGHGQFVPLKVYGDVQNGLAGEPMPTSARAIYRQYVELRYLQWYKVIPSFLCLFVLALYLLGKFLAAGVGKFFWTRFEYVVGHLPLVRNVYSSAKQVTDFLFSERELEITRVVAVEYPRRGLWQMAFVTGEGMLDVGAAANEQLLTVLVPGSPFPFTGFTVMVKRSEAIDLNLTIDQAIQFLVSCGVVVPPQQAVSVLEPGHTNAAPVESNCLEGSRVDGSHEVNGDAAAPVPEDRRALTAQAGSS